MFTDGDEFLLLAKCTGGKKNLAIKHLNTDSSRNNGGGGRGDTQKNEYTKRKLKSNSLGKGVKEQWMTDELVQAPVPHCLATWP